MASAYSVRPTPDARVSAPPCWDEVDLGDLCEFTLGYDARRALPKLGDLHVP